MNLRDLVRPEVLALPRFDFREAGGIRLDNNESPWPAPGIEGDINRYPPQPPLELTRRMASYYGVPPERVLATRGSDDAIDALIRCFCRPGQDSILTTPPTFGMYAVFAGLQGAPVLEVPADANFDLPLVELGEARAGVRLVFLCSPNNPTGAVIPAATVRQTCNAYAGNAIVIVDEAYGEFMQQESASNLLDECRNLVVLRTMSKGLALAGARIGVLLAAPEIIDYVRRVLPPYLLPAPCVRAAEQALADGALEIARKRIKRLVDERGRMTRALRSHPWVKRVWPSEANFLLVECEAAARTRIQSAGIRVRTFNDARLRGLLRIGIGSPGENTQLLQALEIVNAT